jgi:hypothetical protein
VIDPDLADLLREAGITDAEQDRRLRELIAQRNAAEGTRWLERADRERPPAGAAPLD